VTETEAAIVIEMSEEEEKEKAAEIDMEVDLLLRKEAHKKKTYAIIVERLDTGNYLIHFLIFLVFYHFNELGICKEVIWD